jgi:hypothetical protein
VAAERRHQKFVAKVKERNAQHIEPDEQVEQAVGGQTGPVHMSAPLALVDTVRRMTGQLQSRLIILTDRNLYVAYPGFFGQIEIKEVKAKYPRAEAPAHVKAVGKGAVLAVGQGPVLEINGEHIHFRLGSTKFVQQLVEAASSGSPAAAQ